VPVHTQFIRDKNGNLSAVGLAQVGAFFPIEVHVPPQIADVIVKAGQTVPKSVSGIGLIDTGATLTCIQEDILISLGLNPIGQVTSGTANGPKPCNVYPARIVFPTKGWTLDLGQAMGVNLTGQTIPGDPPQPIIALLGRNLLQRSVFIYNGITGFWTITLEITASSST
jgi:hypothetical protein